MSAEEFPFRKAKLLPFTKFQAAALFSFLVPLAVRSIPEVLMGPYPVGFDTVAYYVPMTVTWAKTGIVFWDFVAQAPLFYIILLGLLSTGAPIVLLLKIISPILLGFLSLSIYYYSSKTLRWSPKRSLAASIFATLYFIALRISWDMLRTELGLIFLFAVFVFLARERSSLAGAVLLSLAMAFTVSSHQLVAVVMFFVLAITLINLAFKKRLVRVGQLLACMIPALIVFLIIVYADFLTLPGFSLTNVFPQMNAVGLNSLYGFASYSSMLSETAIFIFLSFCPLLPLILLSVRNFKADISLKAWIVLVFVAISLFLASPNLSVGVLPFRWVLLLSYPVAFFAVDAFCKLKSRSIKCIIASILIVISLGFMFLPSNSAFPYFDLYPQYMPSPMLQNTVPLGDCEDTLAALQWANTNLSNDSFLLVHDAFVGWASLYIEQTRLVNYRYKDPSDFVGQMFENNSQSKLYLIWWVRGWGGHGVPSVNSDFDEVFRSGRIAVYLYNESVGGSF